MLPLLKPLPNQILLLLHRLSVHSALRLTSGIINPVQLHDAKFSSALYLMPRKEQVEEYNTQRLLELAQTTPVCEFKAEHIILESRYLPHGVTSRDVPEQLIPKNDNNCAGLPHTVQLTTKFTLACTTHACFYQFYLSN